MGSFAEDIQRECTQDFVEAFETDKDCKSFLGRLLAMGLPLPDAVDPSDPRVKSVIARCKKIHGYDGENHA